MKKTIFMDKYPVYTLSLSKDEVSVKSVDEIVAYFEKRIESHPIAQNIAVFDHYSHTKKLKGEMMEGLMGAKNIVFCFGPAIPSTKILAARPRSIGVCELKENFVIEFLEAPKEELHTLMESWAKGLVSKG